MSGLQLIPGWRRAWRLSSVRAAAVLVLLPLAESVQQQLLPLFQFAIPAAAWPWVCGIAGAAVIVLRLVAQPGALDEPKPAGQSDGVPR